MINQADEKKTEQQPVEEEKYPRRVIITQTSAFGTYGVKSYSGYPSEEYLAALTGRQKADVYDRMRRSDPQVKMCLSSVKNSIKSAKWEIEPADDSDEAKSDAELINHILFNDLGQPWSKFISEALTCLEFGHSVFEVTHKIVTRSKLGPYNGIQNLGFRSQRTIDRWNLDLKTGALKSITQVVYGDLDVNVDIPAEFLLVFSIDAEGANYEGVSALRPCYGSYFRKDYYMKLNAHGIEKFAIPTPIVTVPSGKEGTEQFNNMIEVLEAYVTAQSNYLTIPEGWEINLNTNTYDPEKVEASINAEDSRMVRAFLANFLSLGQADSGGAYALSNDLSDFFLSSIEQLATEIESVINRSLIEKLILVNRGPREKYPILKHSGISDKAGVELANVLKSLFDGRYIVPDDQLEDHLRLRYNLPKRSAVGQRQVQTFASGGISPSPTAAAQLSLSERIRAEINRNIGG